MQLRKQMMVGDLIHQYLQSQETARKNLSQANSARVKGVAFIQKEEENMKSINGNSSRAKFFHRGCSQEKLMQ